MMNIPLSFTVLAASGQVSHETTFEFYLNRLGINIIEGPKENIWGEIGSTLRLIFKNRGAPTHITYHFIAQFRNVYRFLPRKQVYRR